MTKERLLEIQAAPATANVSKGESMDIVELALKGFDTERKERIDRNATAAMHAILSAPVALGVGKLEKEAYSIAIAMEEERERIFKNPKKRSLR